jgi:monoamine oxidase
VPSINRRTFLGATAGLAGSIALPSVVDASATRTPRTQPRIVVVGAGLAGLSCADALHRSGLRAHVFEARPERIGGRCWSSRGWQADQVAEHGGEFIDTRQTAMLGLARRFGLRLDDTYDMGGGRPRLWLQGARRHEFLGRSHLDHWVNDPWTHGSYAAFLPGQYTRYVGFVGRPEHGLHFAGEHTEPLADQGYLDGAVRSGRRAAREVLRDIGGG